MVTALEKSLCRGVIIFNYRISWKMERKTSPGTIMQRPVIPDLPTETSVSFRCISQFILSNPMGEKERQLKKDRYEPGLSYMTQCQSSVWDHTLPCIPVLCEKLTSDLHITWKLKKLDLDFMQVFMGHKTFTETRKKKRVFSIPDYCYPRLLGYYL